MIETFTAHRQLLFGIAYRMLGRVAEADDMVQETWLRWQRQNVAGIESPKAWLVATITRLCIDQLRSAQREREEYYGVWLPEPLVESHAPAPDETAALADSLSMAFMLMLEALSPAERAVFLLREVFDYEYAEIASIVGKSEANCRQIVRRAKSHLPRAVAVPAAPNDHARRVVQRFLEATTTGQVGDLLALLADDATLYSDGGGRVVAAGRPIESADHISRFFIGIRGGWPADMKLRFTQINGRPGALMTGGGALHNAFSFDVVDGRIQAIYIVRNPEKLRHLSAAAIALSQPRD
ncbi:MAG TPA: RNA polymerase sigma-70 factor [Opitutaceae bacterium]